MKQPGEATLDRWAVAHLASGMLLGLSNATPTFALTSLIAFEILEAYLRGQPGASGKGLTEYESEKNIIADVAVGMIGYVLTKRPVL
jgi:hypothetical protein